MSSLCTLRKVVLHKKCYKDLLSKTTARFGKSRVFATVGASAGKQSLFPIKYYSKLSLQTDSTHRALKLLAYILKLMCIEPPGLLYSDD